LRTASLVIIPQGQTFKRIVISDMTTLNGYCRYREAHINRCRPWPDVLSCPWPVDVLSWLLRFRIAAAEGFSQLTLNTIAGCSPNMQGIESPAYSAFPQEWRVMKNARGQGPIRFRARGQHDSSTRPGEREPPPLSGCGGYPVTTFITARTANTAEIGS
jgi:hypothetical protein